MTPNHHLGLLNRLFHEALEHEPLDRSAFLDSACHGNPELRAEVEELVAEDDTPDGFLDQLLVKIEVATLSFGTRLGPYEILDAIGAGGMGEVYRCRDTRLKRTVAIKVLRGSLSSDRGARKRLEREAQAIARLSHPNICLLYDVCHHNELDFLVMEYLDGETLDSRLRKGPLQVDEFFRYAMEVGKALDEAHRNAIIHRDLKPTNIVLTKSGAKVLDFGLAQRYYHSTTLHAGISSDLCSMGPGTVVGTLPYMSPEQARGETLDPRTDLFSFGSVLYEMATGRQAFAGATRAVIIDALLNRIPTPSREILSLPGLTPFLAAELHEIITKALEKDRHVRYQTASDIHADLDRLNSSTHSQRANRTSAPAVTAAPSHRPRRREAVWSIALIAVILLAAVAWLEIANRSGRPPLRISEYSQLTHNGHTGYVAGTDGSRVYLTHVNTFSIEEVAASGGEIERVASITLPNPFLFEVSPDGSAFLLQSWSETPSPPLYAVQVVGGAHRYLADATPAGATWSPDGKLVAYATRNGDLKLVASDGTGAHKLASVGGDAGPLDWSPDGNTIRFSRNLESLWDITSSGSNLHQLLLGWRSSEQKCCGRWSPDGEFFVFLAGAFGRGDFPEGQIYALDERRGVFRRLRNDPIQLTSGPIEWSPPFFSKDGKKIFATGSTKRGELVRLDTKSGQFQPFLGGISADLIAFSKDGKSVAYVSYPDGILWRANRDGSDRVQLTTPPFRPLSISWSPDGTQLVFEALSPQGPHAWIVQSTGGSPQRLLPEDTGPETEPSWSPDGRTICFSTGKHGGHESHIRAVDLASHHIGNLPDSDGKFSPRWSTDGQFINAASLDSTTIYVFDLKTQHWSALKTGPFADPRWSSDSRSIYFVRWGTDSAILGIPVTGGEAKLVVSLKNFPYTGSDGGLWFGLDPTDAPLMLRDASTTDVYALRLEEK
ncbi:MAG: protein kinase domain-containing protein [Bryobacteraceae bacterium]